MSLLRTFATTASRMAGFCLASGVITAGELPRTQVFKGKTWTADESVALKIVSYMGREALQVRPNFSDAAWLQDVEFESGSIEMDLAAPSRSRPTLALFGSEDGSAFEKLHLIPRRATSDAPKTRLHDATLTNCPTPSIVLHFNLLDNRLTSRDWFHVKITFDHGLCYVFIGDDTQPVLVVGNHLGRLGGVRLVLFGDLGLYCYSLDGEPLWSKPIEPKKTILDYGAAASPVVHWATPFVWENEKRTEIVVPGQRINRSYSLDGEEIWNFDGNMSVLVIPSPFAAHGMCYISSGYVGDAHRPTFAIRPGATGKLAEKGEFDESEFIEWYQPKASPYNTTQIVYGDYLYTVYDQGFMTCYNASTGEEVYGKRRFSPKGSFTASPWAYNGNVFCLSEDGLTYVIKAGPEFEMLNTNPLDELCIATPSVVGGKLLIRTLTKVYCLTSSTDQDQPQQ